jgi:hypothetical protein
LAIADQDGKEIVKASEEEFIIEQFWGYVKRGKFVTSEYRVDHYRFSSPRLNCSGIQWGKIET